MSHVVKSRMRIRQTILEALSYGLDGNLGGRRPSNGAIFKLLQKLARTLDAVHDADIDTVYKLTQAYLKLSALALPTVAQEDAIKKGIPMLGNAQSGAAILEAIQAHLIERRNLIAQSMPTKPIPTESVEIKSIPNLSELARKELKIRESLTPPPMPPPGGVVDKQTGRPPIHANSSPNQPSSNQSGTNQVSIDMSKGKPTLAPEDLDFSE